MKGKLHCDHLTVEDVDSEVIAAVESIERELGVDLYITSGTRCEFCNAAIGGTRHSAHMPQSHASGKCKALDIDCTDSQLRYNLVYKLLLRGFTRIEIGRNWIHCDKGALEDGYAQKVIFLPI